MDTPDSSASSQEGLKLEIESLRRSLLPFFIGAFPVVGWVWYARVIMGMWDLSWNSIPVVALCGAAYAAFRLRHKHYHAACWVMISALFVSYVSLIIAHPQSLAVAFGTVTVLVAHALLGTWQAVLAFGLNTAVVVLAQCYVTEWGGVRPQVLTESALLTAMLLAVAWIAGYPQRTAVEWALEGWEQAHAALAEARLRRGELYRVAKALDEATYRIQRMNNELLLARREAELARAMKARFAATVSHELRAPLNLILGFSAMMVQTPERYKQSLPPEYLEDVETIYRSSQHLASLVDDVLDLSQIEAEQLPLVKDQVDFRSDVVQRVIDTVSPMAERKGLILRVHQDEDLPWVLVDAVRMRQVLINLLSNAVRFTAKGSITVRTLLEDDHLLVSVEDTGTGIAAQDLPRLFQEFHQLPFSEGEEGSGLGLAISKHLVELHGGRIWVESEIGRGSTFYFTVPLPGAASLSVEKLTRSGREAPERPSGPDTCLVIHPNPGIVHLVGRLLEDYHMVGIADYREAPAAIERLHPRAVMASSSCVQRLTAWLDTTPFDVPLISCFDEEPSGCDSGIVSHLVKPVSEEMVRMVMRRVGDFEPTRVLVVDDDPAAVRLLERMLMAIPGRYQVYRAYGGVQALELVHAVKPHVAFIDLVMQDLSGDQVIARMRQDERLEGTKVVTVSAADHSETTLKLGHTLTLYTKRGLDSRLASEGLKHLLSCATPRYLPDPLLSELPQ